jgi:hypothetical protein
LAARLGLENAELTRELSRREKFLERLLSEGIGDIPDVEKAVEAFRDHRPS